jgi:uncharacterized OB-fold protein
VRPLPVPDRDSRAWWDALSRHQLLVQRCDSCARLRWPPRAICGACASFEWAWQATSGRAKVVSWIVNHHPFGEGVPSPYVVVTARLDDQDDILIPGGYSGPPDGEGLAIGATLTVDYEDVEVEDGRTGTLLRWRPLESVPPRQRPAEAG